MGLAETLNRAPFSLCFPDLCNPSHELRSVFSHPFSGMPVPVSKPWPLVPFPCIHRRSLAVPLHKGRTRHPASSFNGEVRMDSVFGMFFWALAIIAFGACIGAGLRGRPGRLFGLTILKIGLAGLFVMLLFVDRFPHNEIILWLLLMLMAGALISHMLFVVRAPKIPSFSFPAGGEAGHRLSAGYPAFLQWLWASSLSDTLRNHRRPPLGSGNAADRDSMGRKSRKNGELEGEGEAFLLKGSPSNSCNKKGGTGKPAPPLKARIK